MAKCLALSRGAGSFQRLCPDVFTPFVLFVGVKLDLDLWLFFSILERKIELRERGREKEREGEREREGKRERERERERKSEREKERGRERGGERRKEGDIR